MDFLKGVIEGYLIMILVFVVAAITESATLSQLAWPPKLTVLAGLLVVVGVFVFGLYGRKILLDRDEGSREGEGRVLRIVLL